MNIQYAVDLSEDERQQLKQLVGSGNPSARRVRRANILLMADRHEHTDEQIVAALSVGRSTVFRTRRRLVEEGLDSALSERGRPGAARKLDGVQEAFLVATACAEPPKGRSKWTLQLLADAVVAGTEVTEVSADTVGRRLRDNKLKPWQRKMWCIPKVDATFVARMEDVLDLYAEPYDPKRPVVCVDEALKQLVCETRTPIPRKPGRSERYDYEYRRGGTANIFLVIDRGQKWRHAKVTERRCQRDYANLMRDLVDAHYPDADCIRVVQDNLNTHKPESLYVTFPPEEARRILRKLEFHYTPKHASWLNMVEIEIGVMSQQCLNRRIGDIETLTEELAAWQRARNDAGATINWMFDVDKARKKLGKAYPQLQATDVPNEAKQDQRKPQETDVSSPTDGPVHRVASRPRERAVSASTWAGNLRGRATNALGSVFGRTLSTLARETMLGAIS